MTFQMEDLKEFCKKTSLHGWRHLAMEDVSHQGSCQTSGETITNITLMNIYIYTLCPFGTLAIQPRISFGLLVGFSHAGICCLCLPPLLQHSRLPRGGNRHQHAKQFTSLMTLVIWVKEKNVMTLMMMMKRNLITQQTSMVLILFDNIPQGHNCDVPGHTERPIDRVVLPLCCGLQHKPGNL